MTATIEEQAAQIAERYHWPDEAALLRRGIVPEGFAKEVGSAIALFMGHGPLMPQTEDNIAHGNRLAELRVLLAEMTLARVLLAEMTLARRTA